MANGRLTIFAVLGVSIKGVNIRRMDVSRHPGAIRFVVSDVTPGVLDITHGFA